MTIPGIFSGQISCLSLIPRPAIAHDIHRTLKAYIAAIQKAICDHQTNLVNDIAERQRSQAQIGWLLTEWHLKPALTSFRQHDLCDSLNMKKGDRLLES